MLFYGFFIQCLQSKDGTLTLIHNDLAKSMSATPRKGYTEMFKASTNYMLEKVVETSIEYSSQITTIEIWEGGSWEEDAKDSQATFPR